MKKKVFPTCGVCSQAIVIELTDGNVVNAVEFIGGCQGNTKGVAALAVGMPAEEVITRLSGIDCGRKGTSCPDQLARALRQMVDE